MHSSKLTCDVRQHDQPTARLDGLWALRVHLHANHRRRARVRWLSARGAQIEPHSHRAHTRVMAARHAVELTFACRPAIHPRLDRNYDRTNKFTAAEIAAIRAANVALINAATR